MVLQTIQEYNYKEFLMIASQKRDGGDSVCCDVQVVASKVKVIEDLNRVPPMGSNRGSSGPVSAW
jgi:hypothetical protein